MILVNVEGNLTIKTLRGGERTRPAYTENKKHFQEEGTESWAALMPRHRLRGSRFGVCRCLRFRAHRQRGVREADAGRGAGRDDVAGFERHAHGKLGDQAEF